MCSLPVSTVTVTRPLRGWVGPADSARESDSDSGLSLRGSAASQARPQALLVATASEARAAVMPIMMGTPGPLAPGRASDSADRSRLAGTGLTQSSL